MAGNLIFRAPTEKQPITVSLPVAAAVLPGTLVEATATQLVVLTTASGKRPLVVGLRDFVGQGLIDLVPINETGIAYEVEPNMVFQVRVAAATYTAGQALTIAASGRMAAAATGNVVVAFYSDVPGAKAAGDLADVTIANFHAMP